MEMKEEILSDDDKISPQASEPNILDDMLKFYASEDEDYSAIPSEIDLLAEEYAVSVGHPMIGDEIHKPKPCLCNPEDLEFAARVRELGTREDLKSVIGERLGLFKEYVKYNSDVVLMERLNDVIKLCKRKDYDDHKLYCAIMITYRTHEYFVASLMRRPMETYAFFRELILCHTDEEPPFSYEVFSPQEASELLLDFCKTYLRNLPLIRHICLPTFALRIHSLASAKDNSIEGECNDIEAESANAQSSASTSVSRIFSYPSCATFNCTSST